LLAPGAVIGDPRARRRARRPRTAEKRPHGDAEPPFLAAGPVASTRDTLTRKTLRTVGFSLFGTVMSIDRPFARPESVPSAARRRALKMTAPLVALAAGVADAAAD
jgi:hypothetical protein